MKQKDTAGSASWMLARQGIRKRSQILKRNERTPQTSEKIGLFYLPNKDIISAIVFGISPLFFVNNEVSFL